MEDWGNNFQTPIEICEFMASFLPENPGSILEPTPGQGNLLKVLSKYGSVTIPKDDFFKMEKSNYDWIIMNPPFTPMSEGYKILYLSLIHI